MPKPPRELTKQIEIIEGIISNLNDLLIVGKIKVEHYGEDFLKPLAELRQDGLALRSKLEIFKNQLEGALTAQYYTSERFAASRKVVDRFLSQNRQ